jgi:hypothetical protein
MKQPKNQQAEVLFLLLCGTQTTLTLTKYGICNPTSAMTHLRRKGVTILCDNLKHKNKFGRPITYGKFNILNKTEATKIYNKINK